MIRRQFLKLAALTSATGLASIGTLDALEHQPTGETKTVHWRVRGFTCPTCAVGLETMLKRQKGVKSVQATYPEAIVTIQYFPAQIKEAFLRGFISNLGFTASAEQKG
ncbi:MAG: hypothetical protein WBD10_06175 [Acidobacteriaceae bacterium]